MPDLLSPAFVLFGTVFATLFQCGIKDGWACAQRIGGLFTPKFNAAKAKSGLSKQIRDIRSDGVLRAEARVIGDAEIDSSTEALIGGRSLDALLARHGRYRGARLKTSDTVRRVMQQASELAPVLGLAGTLLALSGLAGGPSDEPISATIGMAVMTTFYGLFMAHGVFLPLAGMIDRRARAEDAVREDLFRWLEMQVRLADPVVLRQGGQNNGPRGPDNGPQNGRRTGRRHAA